MFLISRTLQRNTDSSFSLGVLKKSDGCGKTIVAGVYNKICTGTTEIERWIRENDTFWNDRSSMETSVLWDMAPCNPRDSEWPHSSVNETL
jgi:hypothetical protein